MAGWAEAVVGDKTLRAVLPANGRPSELVQALGDQAQAAKFNVASSPTGLLLLRPRREKDLAVSARTSHPFIHLTAVGGQFSSAWKTTTPTENALRLGEDLAWLRFGIGPPRLASEVTVAAPPMDGLHRLAVSARRGDETLATTTVRRTIVKKTFPERLRLRLLSKELKLAGPPTPVAAAAFEGVPPGGTVEFRVDEEPIGTATQEPWTVAVDPKRFGQGKHELRARVVWAAPRSRTQEADDLVEFVAIP